MFMNDFIREFGQKYSIEITSSTTSKEGLKHAFVNGGVIEYFCLFNVDLSTLEDLFPIAKDLKVLRLVDCEINDLKGIERFTELIELDLTYTLIAHEIPRLSKLENLKKLNLTGIELEETKILSCLEYVESLNIGENDFTKVLGLSNLENLKELNLSSSLIESAKDICSVDSLIHLNLSQSDIVELEGIDRFQNLKELSLFSCRIKNLKGVGGLKKIVKLNLSYTSISNFNDIDLLLSLKELNCRCTRMTQMDGLDTFPNLEVLNFSGDSTYWNDNPLVIEKIEGLENLKKLKKLNISEQKLTKIEGLDNLSSLKFLELHSNEISEMENIPLTNLKGLNLSANKIDTVKGDMVRMEELLLVNNSINHVEMSFLSKIKSKCIIDLRNNPLTELNSVPENIVIKCGVWDKNRVRLSS